MKTNNHDWQRDRPIEDAAFTVVQLMSL